ncbi:MAG TPA: MFS transporter [Clostridium sp.]|nr:MFS transporter [Clostridium sp.]
MSKRDPKWMRIGGTLMIGLFIAYLDRSTLSVSLTSLSKELGFAGSNYAVVSSWVLTAFLIGYACANVFGGFLTNKFDPKTVAITMIAFWSIITLLTGFVTSVSTLIVFRICLGIAEGVYWPQQSRFARSWFNNKELTTANSVIQYYGQFLALALGFVILTPIYNHFQWHVLFYITGGAGLFIVVPLYVKMLKRQSEAPYAIDKEVAKNKVTFKALGGAPFLLILFSYISQGMLFWGITLWLPIAVKSLGFTGFANGFASSLPYFAAVILALPMSYISDKTGKRSKIAALGLIIPGILLMLLSQIDNNYLKLGIITISLGYYASSYTPNIWTIIQSNVEPEAVGPASGIINGLGAGGGGTIAGFIVGLMYKATGSYMSGFIILGLITVLGGFALLLFEKVKQANILITQDKI